MMFRNLLFENHNIILSLSTSLKVSYEDIEKLHLIPLKLP